MLYRFWLWVLQVLGFDPRLIFRYYDGSRFRNADPMVLLRRQWECLVDVSQIPDHVDLVPFEMEHATKLIQSGVGTQISRGYEMLAETARDIFDVKELADGGLTELECEALLNRFEAYIGHVKKNGNVSPTSPHSTDSADDSAMSNGSGSTSTSTESKIVLPDVSAWPLQSGENPILDGASIPMSP